MTITTTATKDNIELKVQKGLEFILQHLSLPQFPRNIMTYRLGRQVLVHNEQEAMKSFKESDFLDCRISAYSPPAGNKILGTNMISPDIIFIDLDRPRFISERAYKLALSRTLINIQTNLSSIPTVLWSGNGNHIIQPISAFVLEELDLFSPFDRPSVNFLRWAELFLSNGKSDAAHTRTLSFGNCMLRIPGSHNSKCVAANNGVTDDKTALGIMQKWDGYRPQITFLLGSYYAYLVYQKQKNKKINGNKQYRYIGKDQVISWIEKLLETAMPDYRKMIIWLILSRHLINVRGMSYEDAFSIIKEWTVICNGERPLYPSNFDHIIRDRLKQAIKDKKYPIGLSRLKRDDRELFELLMKHNMTIV